MVYLDDVLLYTRYPFQCSVCNIMHAGLTCNTLEQKDPGVDNTTGMKENNHPPGSL